MSDNPLKVVSSEGEQPEQVKHAYTGKQSYKEQMQAKFERMWLNKPGAFDPNKSCMEQERIKRTWDLINKHVDLKGKRVVDLGCASGFFSRMLKEKGATVDAIDISSNAIKIFKEEGADGINVKQGYVPHTILEDDKYDLVLASDLLAHIHRNEHRLFMAELARLVKPDGYVVCSTPLDFHSEDPLIKFAGLAETEFNITEWVLSNFSWYIRARDFFDAPRRFVKASQDAEYRKKKLQKRDTISHWWFTINSSKFCGNFWKLFGLPFKPIANILRKNGNVLLLKEKAAKFVSEETTLSHAIFIGKRRPLVEHVPEKEIPKIHPGKKQVWE